jgi:glycosyltransferase involved in cell wall biosynthesis
VSAAPNAAALPDPLGPLHWPLELREQDYAAAVPAVRPARLPRLTVITPSFNQAPFLELTLRSVLGQRYPNLEYFVMDGGSTDGSADIIRRYEPWLSGWVSERDGGQTDAIAKGLARATGDWFVWINSDDLLAPGALWAVARGDADADVLAGVTVEFQGARHIRTVTNEHLEPGRLLVEEIWHQPSIWLRPQHARAIGIDHGLQYRFDYFLMLRYLARHPRIRRLPEPLAYFRLHDTSKTITGRRRFLAEKRLGIQKLVDDGVFPEREPQLRMMMRTLQWRDLLEDICAQTGRSRFERAREVFAGIDADREARWTATTRRALIRLLLRGGKRRAKPGRSA